MLAWYSTVFGAHIQYRDPALAFLTFDEEHHRFAFADLGVIRPDEDDKDDRGMIGVDHVAWEYGSMRDLLENYAELKAQGITPYWAVNHGMSASLYYADPDGNQMEFTVDTFATKAECSAYFDSSQIAANPVGIVQLSLLHTIPFALIPAVCWYIGVTQQGPFKPEHYRY